MDFSLYWLLILPVFFGLGWLAARFDLKALLRESRELPEAYFKGLNFLLNEKPDEALAILSEAAREHHGATELQFALGGLFRRRGEVDRATRIHQEILGRENLSDDERLKALFELGQDYQKAGLFDRAEEFFEKLLSTEFAVPALLFLKDIYIAEKEWSRAVGVMDQLIQRRQDPSDPRERAHFLCELALSDYQRGREKEARDRLAEALQAAPQVLRPLLILAEWDREAGLNARAIEHYEALAQQDPDLLFLAVEGCCLAYEAIGQREGALTTLRHWIHLSPSIDLIRAVFSAIRRLEGEASALLWSQEVLLQYPSMASLDQYLSAQSASAHSLPPDEAVWRKASEVISAEAKREALFVCQHCGFRAKQFHWHCPACATWESLPVRRELNKGEGR